MVCRPQRPALETEPTPQIDEHHNLSMHVQHSLDCARGPWKHDGPRRSVHRDHIRGEETAAYPPDIYRKHLKQSP